jgi:ATP-dependent RNA/DNA helicase IGHMBP2
MNYFRHLLELLKLEKEEDLHSFLKQTQASSVAEKRLNGLAWYPIAIRGTEMSRGDYLSVEIERTTHHELVHQFRFGMPVALFSNYAPQTDRIEGTVNFYGGNRMKITLRTDELPEWCDNGKLGVDLLFDSNSYQEMQNALKRASSIAEDKEEGHLARILTGKTKPQFTETGNLPAIPPLNHVQQLAVHKILAAQELAIVHGPPGTGKTTTLVEAVKALIAAGEQQILIVAPSNTAVDLLSTKIAAEGLNVLRIGNPARVSTELLSLTLDHKIADHPEKKQLKELKKRASEFKNMAHKYKRNFGRAEREQRNALLDESRKLMKDAGRIEEGLTEHLISKAQVITATLVGANHYTIRDLTFNTLIIDEAGQALEPACWIPLLKAKKVVFAGDHCQLPPTIKSSVAAKNGLSTTLFEKCVALHPESVVLLEEQYRMNEVIMGYPSKIFYQEKLRAHASVAGKLLVSNDPPLEFIDTAGCGFTEKQDGTSLSNAEEAEFLVKHLSKYLSELHQTYDLANLPEIAVISPYKTQVYVLRELISQSTVLTALTAKISVNTVDSFQGQERAIVYISLTRSNSERNIGFLSDIRRMNVAITRAKQKLVIIGDSATISSSAFYANFIQYAEDAGVYKSAWEFNEA